MSVAEKATLSYAGFWIRVWASIIDSILIAIIVWPVMFAVYGADYLTSSKLVHGPLDILFSWVLPAIATILFWMFKQATPGKMAIGARIVDAATGNKASTGQLIGRYLGYFPSTIVFFVGLIWVGVDRRKQGWHDKLAGTVVVRPASSGPEPVTFGSPAS
jgi:uncharacterized RDD family membrane protein YckC